MWGNNVHTPHHGKVEESSQSKPEEGVTKGLDLVSFFKKKLVHGASAHFAPLHPSAPPCVCSALLLCSTVRAVADSQHVFFRLGGDCGVEETLFYWKNVLDEVLARKYPPRLETLLREPRGGACFL